MTETFRGVFFEVNKILSVFSRFSWSLLWCDVFKVSIGNLTFWEDKDWVKILSNVSWLRLLCSLMWCFGKRMTWIEMKYLANVWLVLLTVTSLFAMNIIRYFLILRRHCLMAQYFQMFLRDILYEELHDFTKWINLDFDERITNSEKTFSKGFILSNVFLVLSRYLLWCDV